MNKIILASLAAAGLVMAPLAVNAQAVNVTFEDVDTDDDGLVSYVELQALEADDATPDDADDEISEADFARYDTDGSGFLDAAEFELALTSLGAPRDDDSVDAAEDEEGEENAEGGGQ